MRLSNNRGSSASEKKHFLGQNNASPLGFKKFFHSSFMPLQTNPDIFETAYIFPVQTKQVYPLIKPHRFQKCPIISYKVLKFLLTFVTPLWLRLVWNVICLFASPPRDEWHFILDWSFLWLMLSYSPPGLVKKKMLQWLTTHQKYQHTETSYLVE